MMAGCLPQTLASLVVERRARLKSQMEGRRKEASEAHLRDGEVATLGSWDQLELKEEEDSLRSIDSMVDE